MRGSGVCNARQRQRGVGAETKPLLLANPSASQDSQAAACSGAAPTATAGLCPSRDTENADLPGEPPVRADTGLPGGQVWEQAGTSTEPPTPPSSPPPRSPKAGFGEVLGFGKHSGSNFQKAQCTLNTTLRYSVPGRSSVRRQHPEAGAALTRGKGRSPALAPAGWKGPPLMSGGSQGLRAAAR